MNRKLISILCALLLLCQLSVCASAADNSFDVRSSYWTNDTLYTFVHFSQEHAEDLEVSLSGDTRKMTLNPTPFGDTGATARYLLLMDNASNLVDYDYHLTRFATSLLVNGANVSITLAAMNDDFTIISENITTSDALRKATKCVPYLGVTHDICGGAAKALEYLETCTYQAGDQIHLVILTAGTPYYSRNSTLDKERQEATAQTAAEAMQKYPEVIVHTVCFQEWSGSAKDTLLQGHGLHLYARTGDAAVDAGKECADFTNSLYTLSYPLPGVGSLPMIPNQLILSLDGRFQTLNPVRNLDMAAPAAAPGSAPEGSTLPILVDPIISSESPDPEETEPTEPPKPEEAEPTESPEPEETEPTESSEPEETEPTESTPDESAPAESEAAEESAGAEDPTGGEDEAEIDEPDSRLISLILAGVLVLAVLLAVVLIVVRKKKQQAAGYTVRMQFVVLSGAPLQKDLLVLKDSLTIGSGSQCQIQLTDPAVAPVHARIFMQDDMIFIENMSANTVTSLNGMRLYASNRLRSEDEITVGDTVLRVLF